jgi:hypothetical protein
VECLRTTPRDRIIVDWILFDKDEKTDVLIRKTQEEHIQVIFLCGIEDLATSKHRCGVNYLDQNFEQFFMSGPSYEEWREFAIQHGFASELIQYMDNHQELYIKSPTDDDLPQESVAEQWHILENLSSDMNEWIDENSNPASIVEGFKNHSKYWGNKYKEFLSREDFIQMLMNYFDKKDK